MDAGRVFQRRSRRAPLVLEAADEDLHTTDFDRLVEEAVAAGQYRRAVRLLYLKTLQTLADDGLIAWQRDKTNHAYVEELRRPALRPAFARLTDLFEFVWYGDFPVDAALYARMQQHFAAFGDHLHAR